MPAWATGRRSTRRRRLDLLPLIVILGLAVLLGWFGLTGEAPLSLGEPVEGAAEHIVDGDTLDLSGQRIRIAGIDAPERDQSCGKAGGGQWACGAAATARLRQLAVKAELSCAPEEHDRYGRLVAACRAGEIDLGRTLVAEGLAVANGRYGGDEADARRAGRGIWQAAFIHPAEWRKRQANEPVTPAAPGAGNPSRFERFLAWLLGLLNG